MSSKKALFLDRDGIINIDTKYLHKKEDFVFTDGIFDLTHMFIEAGYSIYVVTNQSGIGRGYYGNDDFDRLTEWMVGEFQERGIVIEDVKYCPHLPDAKCSCRKPKSGMIDEICVEHEIDLEGSWMIGDKPTDIEMAKVAGIGTSVFVSGGLSSANYSFDTIGECQEFLEINKDKIPL